MLVRLVVGTVIGAQGETASAGAAGAAIVAVEACTAGPAGGADVPALRQIAAAHAQFETIFDTISVQEIRERADYPGLRVTAAVSIGPCSGAAVWEVSTADPIVPPPRQVSIERVLGDPITLLGEAPETTIAEKGVAILEGGITSTRWRDCLDVVARALPPASTPTNCATRHGASQVTAASPSNPSQHTWPAPAKSHKRNGSHGAQGTPGIGREAKLGDQITLVASYLDPGFAHGPE